MGLTKNTLSILHSAFFFTKKCIQESIYFSIRGGVGGLLRVLLNHNLTAQIKSKHDRKGGVKQLKKSVCRKKTSPMSHY